MKNLVALFVTAVAALGAHTSLQADTLPVNSKANTPEKKAAATPARKPEIVGYAQGGSSIAGSHLPLPVVKDRGHYYVNSAFSAKQVVLYEHSTTGMNSRNINLDEVSNLPANHPKRDQPKKKQSRRQPAASNGDRS